MDTPIGELCEGIPQSFMEYIKYCRGLKFEERPNYNYLRQLFVITATKFNIIPQYYWCE
jgi:hypothetical protein